jgi:imidazolonepropionase-like amidohydrolase
MPDLVIENVEVVNVANGSTMPGQSILIADGRIEAILSGIRSSPVPTIDGTGLWASPGLIDAHVHFFFDGGDDPFRSFLSMDRQAKMQVAVRNADVAIRAGITTMRDLGAPADLWQQFQEAVDQRSVSGPRIISSGAPLTRPQGHCYFFGGEVSTVKDVRSLIERQRASGALSVKLMASGGGMTPGTKPHEADLPLELMRVAREVAHANGMTISAHCHATESIERAIDAQIDSIEHVGFVEPPGRWRYDEQIAIRIKDAGIAVCPTAANGIRAAKLFRDQRRPHNPEDVAAVERLEGRRWMTGEFHRLGLKIIGGSDCGADVTPFNSLIDEVETFVSVGLSNEEALRAVTCESAALLRLERVGELKIGYDADIILLRANPLADVRNLRDLVIVIRAGRIAFDARSSPTLSPALHR